MKTLLGTLLALGLLSSAASAQWCPPGYGYGPRLGYGQSFHRPAHAPMTAPIAVETQAPTAQVGTPIEPAPLPQPAPEAAPPK